MSKKMIDENWPAEWAETIAEYRAYRTRENGPGLNYGARVNLRGLAMSAAVAPHAVTTEMLHAYLGKDPVTVAVRSRRLTDVLAFYRWMLAAGHTSESPGALLNARDVICAHRGATRPPQ